MRNFFIEWFPKVRDLVFLWGIVVLISLFCFFGVPEDLKVNDWISGWIGRVPEEGNGTDEAFLFILIGLLALLTGVAFSASWLRHRNFSHAWVWLRFLWIPFAITFVILVLKVLVYDSYLADNKLFYQFDGTLPLLFGFSTTLYAFVAGFILFYSLQEHSNISKEFKQEIGAWHAIFDLLRFFEKSKDDADTHFKERSLNHSSALKGRCLITEIEVKEDDKASSSPEKSLDALYETILSFKVLDDNDSPALDALIQKYSMLRVLMHQRRDRRVDSPALLELVVWMVAFVIIVFASLAVLSLFVACPDAVDAGGNCSYGPDDSVSRLVFAISIAATVLPITMINLTIRDLGTPFTGEWKIDIAAEYKNMSEELYETMVLGQFVRKPDKIDEAI